MRDIDELIKMQRDEAASLERSILWFGVFLYGMCFVVTVTALMTLIVVTG